MLYTGFVFDVTCQKPVEKCQKPNTQFFLAIISDILH